MHMYDAYEIARFIIQSELDNKRPISNLKLQGLMYFTYQGFYKYFWLHLFPNEFRVLNKIVVSSVYDLYRMWLGNPITLNTPFEIKEEWVARYIQSVLHNHRNKTVRELNGEAYRHYKENERKEDEQRYRHRWLNRK